jgi:hypothetical protein
MNNLFFNLSKELQDLIYSYDSTYYNIYNDVINHILYINNMCYKLIPKNIKQKKYKFSYHYNFINYFKCLCEFNKHRNIIMLRYYLDRKENDENSKDLYIYHRYKIAIK